MKKQTMMLSSLNSTVAKSMNPASIELLKLLHFNKYAVQHARQSLIIVLIFFLRKLLSFPFFGKIEKHNSLALGSTLNQHRALEGLVKIDNSICHKTFSSKFKYPKFPIGSYVFLYGIRIVFYTYFSKKIIWKLSCKRQLVLVILFLASYKSGVRLFKKMKIKSLWLSNDHTSVHLGLLAAARRLKIRTNYLQHAHVTNIFPRLTFDYAYLDGKMAASLYKSARFTKSILIGPIRYYGLLFDKDKVCSLDLLIGVNGLDDIHIVAQYIKDIKKQCPTLKIGVKPHPGLKKVELEPIQFIDGVVLFKRELSLLDLLPGSKFFIGGDTSAHLEAVLAGAISCYKNFGSNHYDYYGFIAAGLSSTYDFCEIFFQSEKIESIRLQQANALKLYFENIGKIKHKEIYREDLL
jgi:hypothetical protein